MSRKNEGNVEDSHSSLGEEGARIGKSKEVVVLKIQEVCAIFAGRIPEVLIRRNGVFLDDKSSYL